MYTQKKKKKKMCQNYYTVRWQKWDIYLIFPLLYHNFYLTF